MTRILKHLFKKVLQRTLHIGLKDGKNIKLQQINRICKDELNGHFRTKKYNILNLKYSMDVLNCKMERTEKKIIELKEHNRNYPI